MPIGFTTGVPNANIFYEKHFFPLLSLAFHARKKKRCQWVQKALKSHMKIENITSVHNYFMLHITCSTKSQTTLCSSVPDMPIICGGRMYWNYCLNVVKGQFTHIKTRPLSLRGKLKMRCVSNYECASLSSLWCWLWACPKTLTLILHWFKWCFLYYFKFTVLIQCSYS